MKSSWLPAFALIWLVFSSCSKESTSVDCTLVNLNFTVNITDSECGVPGGAIEVAPAAGVDIARYRINEEPWQSAGLFPQRKPGEYLVTVENADGCSFSKTVVIRSGISFQAVIEPIIAKSCAIPACHDGSGNIDYRVFENFNPADMKARTQSGNMPKEGSLTPAEIEAIACWVDDGALNN